MKAFPVLICVLALCHLSLGEETGFGFDRPSGDEVVPPEQAPAEEMDQVLRPYVFARYERLPDLIEEGNGLYRALYRLPASVYAPDRDGKLLPVQKWLEEEGVEFGPGASVSFEEEQRILKVVQTIEQLTRVELFLGRFGGNYVARIGLDVFELPLLEGWELMGETRSLEDHSGIDDEARKLGARVVESFSSILDLGMRSKLQRSIQVDSEGVEADQESPSPFASFEYDPYYIERFNELVVSFVYQLPAGEFEARKVVSNVRIPNLGGAVVSSWKSGDKLQFLFLSGEVTRRDAVERVRRVSDF